MARLGQPQRIFVAVLVDRGAREEVRHRVHAEREGDVRAVVGAGADQREGALEGAQAVLHVLGRARIEERPPGRAARAPVLHHPGARLDAELLVEALRRDAAQLLLREERDAVPDVFRVPGRDSLLQKRRFARPLHGDALALALDIGELGPRFRPTKVHAVKISAPGDFVSSSLPPICKLEVKNG